MDSLTRMTIFGIERNAYHGTTQDRAFTLLEMILVAALLAISVAVAAPYFVQSIRGNRLQVGARTVTMAARYARSMAIMRQQTFRLTAILEGNELTISAAGDSRRGADELYTASSFDAGAISSPEPSSGDGDAPATIRRELDGVRIMEFRTGDGDWQREGGFEVLFYPNGTCSAFELRLQERAGRVILIQVDELGSVRAIREDGAG